MSPRSGLEGVGEGGIEMSSRSDVLSLIGSGGGREKEIGMSSRLDVHFTGV
jgi:hypothetical protein